MSDNGQGIEPKYTSQIFEPIKRLRRKDGIEGPELGLKTCKRVMEIHAGLIHMDTELHTGSRFIMMF